MQTIIFDKSPLTLKEFYSLNWKHIRKTRKRWFVVPTFLVLLFCVNSCNILIGTKGLEGQSIFDGLWPACIFIIVYGFLYYSIVKAIKKNYLNTPALAEGLVYTLSDESITVQGTLVNGTQPWPVTFKTAFKIGKWILLSSSGTAFYFLDIEKLIAPATIADIKELFQKKGIKLKE